LGWDHDLNRDPERVTIGWDATKSDGFTTRNPWLPMRDRAGRNVADLQNNERSIRLLYRKLLQFRKQAPALHCGEYAPMRSRDDVLIYQRHAEKERFTVALNLTHAPAAPRVGNDGHVDVSRSNRLSGSGYRYSEAGRRRHGQDALVLCF
jgi:alpha-glucosidase